MARLGIDAHAIGGRLTGNETYIANLIDGILALDTRHEFIVFMTKHEMVKTWRERNQKIEVVALWPENPAVRIPLVMPLMAMIKKVDMLHVQYVGPPMMRTPLIATIHDISFETHPEFFSRREYNQFRCTFRFTARRAEKVITISEHSKRDLVEIYKLPEEKVVVTYLAASDRFKPLSSPDDGIEIHERYGIREDYILTVGNLQPRKNIVRLIKAYTRLRDALPDIECQLVIVGQKAWMHDPILDFVRKSRWASDIIITGYVPEDDLQPLYARATLFVYPSIYEGFGLPPLEAMACGTPVIVSNRTSLPEVVGSGGVQIDPYDINGMAAAMAVMLREPACAQYYREAGLRQARRFSWNKCAAETMSVYEEVVEKGRGF